MLQGCTISFLDIASKISGMQTKEYIEPTLVVAPVGEQSGGNVSPDLVALKSLFQDLLEYGVKYTHWKSNLRLNVSLQGRTDLDLLIA